MFQYSLLCISIAGIKIALETDDQKLRLGLEGAMKKFLIDKIDPDVEVIASWSDFFEASGGKKIFDSGALWQLYSDNGSFIFQFT